MYNVIWAFWPPEANQSISQRPLELQLGKVLKVLKLLIPGASGRPPEGLKGHLRGLLEAPGIKTFKAFKTLKSGGLQGPLEEA